MNLLALLDWPARILIGALVAGAVGGGAFLLVRASGDDNSPAGVQLIATPTPTAVMDALPTPSPTPTASALPPTATTLPPADVPPAPTPDTRVAIRDLPAVDQIQLAKDGTYFISDRGDGCTWVEHSRVTDPEVGLQVALRTDCPTDFGIVYRPESGEVFHVVS